MLEHGVLIWEGALGAFLVFALVWPAVVIRGRLLRSGRRARARMGAVVPRERFDDGAAVVLEGRLEVAAGMVPRPGDEVPVAVAEVLVDDAGDPRRIAHRQARVLALVGDGATVEVSGRLALGHGTRERHGGLSARWAGRRLRECLGQDARELRGALIVRSVASGDRVRVAGRLERVSAAEDVALYRDAAARWRLGPATEDGTLPVAGVARAVVSGPSPLVLLRRSAIALAAFCALFGGGGQLALTLGRPDLALATPFARQPALDRLLRRALAETRATGHSAPALARLVRQSTPGRDRCVDAVALLARMDLPREAISLAESCRTPAALRIAAGQWRLLGEPGRSARIYADLPEHAADDAEIATLILAGDAARAATALQRWPATAHPARDCLVQALLARTDSAGLRDNALAALRAFRSQGTGPQRLLCGILLADALEGRGARAAELALLPRAAPGSSWDELVTLLSWEADPGRVVPDSEPRLPIGAEPSSLGYAFGPWVHAAPGLEASVYSSIRARRDAPALALQARLAVSRANLEAIAGDTRSAGIWAAEALEALRLLAEPADPWGAAGEDRGRVLALRASIVLRSGDASAARDVADIEAPWQRTNLDYAIQELESLRGTRASPPRLDQTPERVLVRQGARLLQARFEGDADRAQQISHWVRRQRTALLSRELAVPLALFLDRSMPLLANQPASGNDYGLVGVAAIATDPVIRRMQEIHAVLGAAGVAAFPIGGLANGSSATFPVRMQAGDCRTFVAVGGPGVSDLELTVTFPDGSRYQDGTLSDLAIVRACSQTLGTAQVQVRMAAGAGTVGLQAFLPAPVP